MIKLREIITRKKGEESANTLNKILENDEVILKYALEDGTEHYSDELMLNFAEEYDKNHPVEEGGYVFVELLAKGSQRRKDSTRWEPYYYFATGIDCRKQNGKLVITRRGYMGC